MNSKINKVARCMTAVTLLLGAGISRAGEVSILQPMLYHGNECETESGGNWWGLFPIGEGYELAPVTVTVTRAHDAIMDAEGEMTGKRVTIDRDGRPLVLIKGMEKPKIGPVRTNFSGSRFYYPGQSESIMTSRREHYTLYALGSTQETDSFVHITDYRLKLFRTFVSESPQSQELAKLDRIDSDGPPRLLWSGDLDRDGKPDLLMDLSYHYNVSVLTLFLSSKAKPGELVGLAAQLITSGC